MVFGHAIPSDTSPWCVMVAPPQTPEALTESMSAAGTSSGHSTYGIALGYEDFNDHEILREDPLIQLLSGHALDSEEAPASPPTLSTQHCAKSLTSADLTS